MKVVPGQYVRPAEELLTLVDLDPIGVEVQVLEREVGYLAPRQRARVSFAVMPDRVFQGRSETINPLVESSTRTAKVTLSVPNPAGRILTGTYARVALEARRFADRVLVPPRRDPGAEPAHHALRLRGRRPGRHRRAGDTAEAAAERGARETVLPVLAATLTTAVVFVPFL